MKKLLHCTIMLLVSTIIFSSCKNVSVTKRKYTKGYYVSHSGKKNAVKKQGSSVALNTPETAPAHDEPTGPVNAVPGLPVSEQPGTIAGTTPPDKTRQHDDQPVQTPKHKHTFSFPSFPSIHPQAEKQADGVNPKPEAGLIAAALSLFWIVIVVILVFYLVAILVGGLGLGWTLHLLGVVILILLILWLLGVV